MNDASPTSVVFLGSKALCHEFGLVLESKGIEYDMLEIEADWGLSVAAEQWVKAQDELARYSTERAIVRPRIDFIEPFAGARIGVLVYASILLLTAYAAGLHCFGTDWYGVGALDAGKVSTEWWRALTALTLHADAQHLLGNLFSGSIVGIAAGRLLGPGVAWGSAVAAAAVGNYLEMWISPADHRAIGASSAVFAALGLLTGLAWTHRLRLRERHWYRWAPLIAGVCLLPLLGAGSEHVDVLGHLLGFLFGTIAGWLCAKTRMPRGRSMRVQVSAGVGIVGLLGVAWLLALRHAG